VGLHALGGEPLGAPRQDGLGMEGGEWAKVGSLGRGGACVSYMRVGARATWPAAADSCNAPLQLATCRLPPRETPFRPVRLIMLIAHCGCKYMIPTMCHVQVATPEDPASSRRGENLYAFIPRSVWGNLVDG